MKNFAKKSLILFVCFCTVFMTVPAFAADMQPVIDSVDVNHETNVITVSGHVENYVQLFLKQYITLKAVNSANGEIRSMAQLETGEKGSFEYSFLHNAKSSVENCLISVKLSGVDRICEKPYYVTGSNEYGLFGNSLAFANGAETYFDFGDKKETLEIPFAKGEDFYIPKSALIKRYSGAENITGVHSGGAEYVSVAALNGADIPAYYDLKSGIATVGEEVNSDSLVISKAMFGIYVSQEKGSDLNTGYFDFPAASLEKAVEIALNSKGNPTVYLCDKIYRVNNLVEFKDIKNIRFKAYGKSGATITKSVHIPAGAFEKATPEESALFSSQIPENRLLCVNLADYIGTVGERSRKDFIVYDGGFRADNARWPNGNKWAKSVFIPQDEDAHDKIGIDKEKADLWGEYAEEGFFEIYSKTGYNTLNGNIISAEKGEKDGEEYTVIKLSTESGNFIVGGDFYVENIPAELDMPGEWYINAENNKLYYYPKENFAGLDITLPKQQSSVITPGTGSIGDGGIIIYNSENISFEGISFSCINGDGLSIVRSKNIDVKGGSVFGTGRSGISVQGSVECDIENMRIYDVSDTGIEINNRLWSMDTGYVKTLTHENNTVENCEISDVGNGFAMSSGIFLYGCGNTARNNIIHDMLHQGVYISGPEHTFANNDVYGVCRNDSDAGMIYVAGVTAQGTVIENNAIHSQPRQGSFFAVYLDDAASGVTVKNNYIYNVSPNITDLHMWTGGIWINGGSDVCVKDNVLADVSGSVATAILQHNYGGFHGKILEGGSVYKTLSDIYGGKNGYGDIWKTRYPHLFELYRDITGNEAETDESGKHISCSNELAGIPKNVEITNNIIAGSKDIDSEGIFNISPYLRMEKSAECVVPNLNDFAGSEPVITDGIQGLDNSRIKYSEFEQKKEEYLEKLDVSAMGVPQEAALTDNFAPEVNYPYNGGIYKNLSEITWSKQKGADLYRITLSKNADLSEPVKVAETASTAEEIGETLEGGTYYYRIDGIRKSNIGSKTAEGEIRSFSISNVSAEGSGGSLSSVPCDGSVLIKLSADYSGIKPEDIKLKLKGGAELEAEKVINGTSVTVSGKELLSPSKEYVIEISCNGNSVSVPFKTSGFLSAEAETEEKEVKVNIRSLLEKTPLSFDLFYAEYDLQSKAQNVQKKENNSLGAKAEISEKFKASADADSAYLYIWSGLKPLADKIKLK